MASLVGRVEDLVVEDREVQGEAETDWVCGGKVGLSNLGGGLVCLERLVGRGLALVSHGELGEVTVVVTLPVQTSVLCMPLLLDCAISHLVVENLGLASLSRWDEVLVQNLEDVFADLGKLSLNLLAVLLDEVDLRAVAL